MPQQIGEDEREGEQAEHEGLQHFGGHIKTALSTGGTATDDDRMNSAKDAD